MIGLATDQRNGKFDQSLENFHDTLSLTMVKSMTRNSVGTSKTRGSCISIEAATDKH